MEPKDPGKRKGWKEWATDDSGGYEVHRPLDLPRGPKPGVFPTLQAAVMYVEIEVSNGN